MNHFVYLYSTKNLTNSFLLNNGLNILTFFSVTFSKYILQ